MTDWLKYWTTNPKTVGETEYQKQVDSTINGEPYPDWQFQLMVSEICNLLELEKDDVVLDLCCGNGLITIELAKKCREVVGIDFSEPLLEVANRDHRPAKVNYQHINVLNLDKMPQIASGPFNKVLMHSGLQFFRKRGLIIILRNILSLTDEGGIILLGNIPDSRKKWKFYNTHQRQRVYLLRKIIGRDAIGTWWGENFIRETCKQLNLQCEFYEQSKELHTSHYRFDVRIS